MNIYKSDNKRDSIFDDDYIDPSERDEKTEYTNDEAYEYDEDDDKIYYKQKYNQSNDDEFYDADMHKKTSKFSLKKLITILLIGFAIIVFVSYLMIPDKTNFLLMATDKDGTRTDTIMILSFDKTQDSISVMSVPRDTYVTVSDEMFQEMSSEYPEPGSKSMKINAVHHFSSEKDGADNLKTVVEELLGLKIHYKVKIDFDAFKYIVDAIGGVDFYVPRNMVYNDPVQNLSINLPEGMQHLNGEQAEHVVRYRSGYANGDIGRVEVQQQFMKAFMEQALSPKTIITHPTAYINALTNYFETDFGIVDALAYMFAVRGVDTQNIDSCTLPGYAKYVGGQSVYMLSENELDSVISDFR